MVDTISAPLDDVCVIESCRRLRSEHRLMGHSFVAESQLADSKPRPRDPFMNIRKMTDAERSAAHGMPLPEREGPIVMKTEQQSDEDAPVAGEPVCQLQFCQRPKSSHRGSIGHRYIAPGVDPSSVKPTKRASQQAEPHSEPAANGGVFGRSAFSPPSSKTRSAG
jgi:hypothetical protein